MARRQGVFESANNEIKFGSKAAQGDLLQKVV